MVRTAAIVLSGDDVNDVDDEQTRYETHQTQTQFTKPNPKYKLNRRNLERKRPKNTKWKNGKWKKWKCLAAAAGVFDLESSVRVRGHKAHREKAHSQDKDFGGRDVRRVCDTLAPPQTV